MTDDQDGSGAWRFDAAESASLRRVAIDCVRYACGASFSATSDP